MALSSKVVHEASQAISKGVREAIMCKLGRGITASLGEIHQAVLNDFGRVTARTISRNLAALIKQQKVRRDGPYGHATYTRSSELYG
jgi:hypothetical protein